MSDGILSQAEIDALLGVGDKGGAGRQVDLEAIGEVARIAVEAGVEALGEMVNAGASARLSGSELGPASDLIDLGPQMAVRVDMRGEFAGKVVYLLSTVHAAGLGEVVLGDAGRASVGAELNPSNAGAFHEAMNTVGSQLATAMSTILMANVEVDVHEPVPFDPSGAWDVFPVGREEQSARCDFHVSLGDYSFDLAVLIPVDTAERLLDALAEQLDEEKPKEASPKVREPERSPKPAAPKPATAPPRAERVQQASVSDFEFSDFGQRGGRSEPTNLDFLLDVPLEVTVELGRAQMQIREVLDLGKGSVIELDKLAGEPVEIFVNGKLIAKGEVVTIDENFGVKITEIVSRRERVSTLQ